ncbi:MAG: LD-carboxypeptidase [Nitrospirae bacterium]|jgi:muramoyltetrapeptide carboxypeptidase|nr:LD-carboxypeptidase [Nitrospirota bacterium]
MEGGIPFNPLLKPSGPLKEGDRLTLVSSSLYGVPESYPDALDRLRDKGLEIKNGDPDGPANGPFSANDQKRAEALFRAFSDKSSAAVLALRGGYGAIRLLPHLDAMPWTSDHFPVWTGFSDATNLHAFFWNRLNAVTFHGPHPRGLGASPESFDWFWEMVSGKCAKGCGLPIGRAEVIRPGTAEGKLLGGNLETLTHLAGTRWFPDLEGAVLLIEDVDEPLYAIDRSLWQLAQMGVFSKITGLVLGPFSGRPVRADDPGNDVTDLLDAVCPKNVPVLRTPLPGHDLPMATWPLNIPVRMTLPALGAPSLTLLESPFSGN